MKNIIYCLLLFLIGCKSHSFHYEKVKVISIEIEKITDGRVLNSVLTFNREIRNIEHRFVMDNRSVYLYPIEDIKLDIKTNKLFAKSFDVEVLENLLVTRITMVAKED